MLAGLNLNVGVTGAAAGSGTFGSVGTVNAAGVYQSGAQHLRRSGATLPGSFTTLQTYLAYGDFENVTELLVSAGPIDSAGPSGDSDRSHYLRRAHRYHINRYAERLRPSRERLLNRPANVTWRSSSGQYRSGHSAALLP